MKLHLCTQILYIQSIEPIEGIVVFFLLETCWARCLSPPSSLGCFVVLRLSPSSPALKLLLFFDEGYFVVPKTSLKIDDIDEFEDLRQRHTPIVGNFVHYSYDFSYETNA